MKRGLWGTQAPRRVTTEAYWKKAKSWNRKAAESMQPKRVFCGSWCDVFENHETADATRPQLWNLIRETPDLNWLLLTKRPERIGDQLPRDWGEGGYANVWLGTSIENAHYAHRSDHLKAIPAAVRFISYEPAIGPLDNLDLEGIDWVIYGGESGPGHRNEDKDWARSMLRECRSKGVAFFHKQSAGPRTEMGVRLDGELIREYPQSRNGVIS